jgi:hypothetical protein
MRTRRHIQTSSRRALKTGGRGRERESFVPLPAYLTYQMCISGTLGHPSPVYVDLSKINDICFNWFFNLMTRGLSLDADLVECQKRPI